MDSKTIQRWRYNPIEWVTAMFGDNIRQSQLKRGITPRTETGLSLQQEDALTQWGELLESKEKVGLNLKPTDRQKMLAKKMGMSIQSSNGNGKDFLAALINLHFMSTAPYCKCRVTANTGKQLKSVYWSELSKLMSLGIKPEGSECTFFQEAYSQQNDYLYANLPDKSERGKRWFTQAITINAKSTPEEQGEAMAGLHADFMLILVDEASGVADAVFKPLERTLTGLCNVAFLIFNPTRNTGYAIDTQTKYRDSWLCLQWDALDCENVSDDQIERMRKYGEDSPAYRIGVLGLPPRSDESALIPFEWVQSAIGRDLEVTDYDPVICGVDPAAGGDRSVVSFRRGGMVYPFKTNNSPDTMVGAEWICSELRREDAIVAVVDTVGLGRVFFDKMRSMGINCKAAHGSAAPSNDKCFNLRAEMYWKLREQFENMCISIPDDPELVNELAAIKTEIASNGKFKIAGKQEIRRKFGYSPDKADALALSYLANDAAYRRNQANFNSINYERVFLR